MSSREVICQGTQTVTVTPVFSLCSFPAMALCPGVVAFSPAHARVLAEVLFQTWLLPRMCCLYWALIPALLMTVSMAIPNDVTIDGVSRGQKNSWNNPKRSHRKAAGVVSWHAVDLDLLLHLPALHWLSMVRSTEKEWEPELMDPTQLQVFLSSLNHLWCH